MTGETLSAPRPRQEDAATLPAISVLMVIDRPQADLAALIGAYCDGLTACGHSFEILCVLDGRQDEALASLERLRAAGLPLKVLAFERPFGEAAALSVAARHAKGEVLLTLPAYTPIAAADIGRLLAALEGCDMVVGRRDSGRESRFDRLKAKVLNRLLRVLLKSPFQDLGSGVRALRREVMGELTIYGDQHLFLPLLAAQQGFVVEELALTRAAAAPARPGMRLGRLLDVVAIYFLIRFTRRPFRFFGSIGLGILLLGLLATLWLVVERLFFGVGLAERPVLILSTLLIVLGFQITAVGLIGEIITFTHAKDLKEYKVARILE